MSDLKSQIELSVDATGVEVGVERAKRSLSDLGNAASSAGKAGAEGVDKIRESSERLADTTEQVRQTTEKLPFTVDKATKNLAEQIQRATAAMQAGSKGTAEYYAALANTRGANVQVLKPYLDQLDQAAQKTKLAAEANKRLEESTRFLDGLKNQTDSIGKTASQLAAMRAAQLGVTDAAGPMIKKLAESEKASAGAAGAFGTFAKSALAAAAAAFSIGALVEKFHQAVDALAKLDDMSQKTGSSVENLSRLQKVASAFGADFNNVDSALNKLAKGMATVDDESNKVNKALTAIGVSSKDAAGKLRDPSEVMVEVAKRLQDYQDGAAKAALMTDLFGKAGADLLPYMNDLAENVDKFSVSSAEAAKAAADMQDNLGRLKVKSQELYTAIASAALPSMIDFTTALLDAKGATNGLANDPGLKNWAESAADAAAFVIDAFDGVVRIIELAGKRVGAVAAAGALAAQGEFSAARAALDAFDADRDAIFQKKFFSQRLQEARAARKEMEAFAKENEYGVGLAGTPAGGKPTLDYTSGRDGKDVKEKLSDYDKLIRTIKEKTSAEELELQGTEKLTEGQKLASKVMVDIRDGTIKLTDAEKRSVTALLETYLATEKANDAKQKRQKLDKELGAYSANVANAIDTSNKQLAIEYALYGKSNDARELAMVGLKAEQAAEKELARLQKEGYDLTEDDIKLLREKAKALGDLEKANQGQSKALAYANQLSQDNRRFAAESIADEETRAARLLEIDAEVWQERIQNAGHGTEAQKRLQQEFDQWYANRQLTPVLDRWKNIIQNLDNDFREGFRDMLTHGKNAWDSFAKALGNTLKTSLADALYQTFIKKYVVQIVASLAGAISGPAVAGALTGGGGILGAASSAASLYNGAGTFGNLLGAGGSAAGTIGSAVTAATGAGMDAAYAAASYDAAVTASGFGEAAAAVGELTEVAGTATGALGTLTSALAAVPVWGWALGAAAIASQFLGGGEMRYGAGYNVDFASGKAVQSGGPSGGAIGNGAVEKAIEATYTSLAETLKAVGSKAIIQQFTAGLETSENGKGGTFAGGVINGQVFGQRFEEARYNQDLSSEQAIAQLATDLKQATIEALQAATDIPKSIADQLKGIDAEKLTDQAATAVLNTVSTQVAAVTAFQSAVKNLPFENLKNLSFDAANGLIAAAGGFDALNANLTGYFQNYFTSEEKKQQLTTTLTEEFGKLGFSLPTTREQFRAMVESVKDLGGDGAKTEAGLLALQGALNQLLPPLEDLTSTAGTAATAVKTVADLFQEQMGNVDKAYSALERSVEAEKANIEKTTQAQIDAVRKAADAQKELAQQQLDAATGSLQAVQAVYNSLGNALNTARAMSQAEAQRILDQALAKSNAGGSLANIPGLDEALRTVTQTSAQSYATQAEFLRDQALTANKIEALKNNAGAQVSVAQMTVGALKDNIKAIQDTADLQIKALEAAKQAQIDRLDGILLDAKNQIDALNGIDNSVKSVADAVRQLGNEIALAVGVKNLPAGAASGSGSSSSAGANADPMKAVRDYGAQYGADAYYQTSAQSLYATKLAAVNAVSSIIGTTIEDEFVRQTGHTQAYWQEVQRQLDAGLHPTSTSIRGFAVGTNYVPNDMVAQIHEGERIIPKADNAALIRALQAPSGDGELVAENRALRDELSGMRKDLNAALYAIAKYTQTSADVLEAAQNSKPLTTTTVAA